MATRIAFSLLMLFLSNAAAETELVVGRLYKTSIFTKDGGAILEILISSDSSLFLYAFVGSGAQFQIRRIHDPAAFSVNWSSPCEQIQPNVSSPGSSQGYWDEDDRYSFSYNFTEQGELQVLVSGFVRWSTNTSGRGVVKAVLSGNDLLLLNATNTAVWRSRDYKSAALCPEPVSVAAIAATDRVPLLQLLIMLLLLLGTTWS